MPDQPWYVEFFGDDYLRLYRPYLTPERTEREALGIVRCLNLRAGSKILDLCCGHGRIRHPPGGARLPGYRPGSQPGVFEACAKGSRRRERACALGTR